MNNKCMKLEIKTGRKSQRGGPEGYVGQDRGRENR